MVTITQNLLKKTKKTRYSKQKRLPLQNCPQRSGRCEKVTVRSPKKPCSGKRAVTHVNLTSRSYVLCKISGDKQRYRHGLAKFSHVLVRGGRVLTIPECHYIVTFAVRRAKYGSLRIDDQKTRGRSL